MSVERHGELLEVARETSLSVHLDGARIFNAATALGSSPDRLAAGVDSVYVDLTKGLACPMGALIAGSPDLIEEARWRRRQVGGGMRQAGLVAACGLVALDELVSRLEDDHLLARWLATRISDIEGYTLDPLSVETNIVNVDVSTLGESADITAKLAREGLMVTARPPGGIRLVTHLQVTQADAEEALRILAKVGDACRR